MNFSEEFCFINLLESIEKFKHVSIARLLSDKFIQISTNYALKNKSELFTLYLYIKNEKFYLTDGSNTLEDILYTQTSNDEVIKAIKFYGYEFDGTEIRKIIKIENLETEIEKFIEFAKYIEL